MTTDSGQDLEGRIAQYEGLVRKTTSMYCHVFGEDFEDFAQTLRVKVCEALLAFDSSRSKMTEEAYVYGCLRNRVKDYLRKKHVRTEAGWSDPLFIEDVAPGGSDESGTTMADSPRDAFDARYLATAEEQAYEELMREIPLIPSSLDEQERRIVALLYVGFNQVDVARQLGITRSAAIAKVKTIQEKLADWKPASPAEAREPVAA